jgi:hypothetical protein
MAPIKHTYRSGETGLFVNACHHNTLTQLLAGEHVPVLAHGDVDRGAAELAQEAAAA